LLRFIVFMLLQIIYMPFHIMSMLLRFISSLLCLLSMVCMLFPFFNNFCTFSLYFPRSLLLRLLVSAPVAEGEIVAACWRGSALP
jgi:hypothetical protein